MSSSRMTTTFGASGPGCGGAGHQGSDSAWVRPMTPSKGSNCCMGTSSGRGGSAVLRAPHRESSVNPSDDREPERPCPPAAGRGRPIAGGGQWLPVSWCSPYLGEHRQSHQRERQHERDDAEHAATDDAVVVEHGSQPQRRDSSTAQLPRHGADPQRAPGPATRRVRRYVAGAAITAMTTPAGRVHPPSGIRSEPAVARIDGGVARSTRPGAANAGVPAPPRSRACAVTGRPLRRCAGDRPARPVPAPLFARRGTPPSMTAGLPVCTMSASYRARTARLVGVRTPGYRRMPAAPRLPGPPGPGMIRHPMGPVLHLGVAKCNS